MTWCPEWTRARSSYCDCASADDRVSWALCRWVGHLLLTGRDGSWKEVALETGLEEKKENFPLGLGGERQFQAGECLEGSGCPETGWLVLQTVELRLRGGKVGACLGLQQVGVEDEQNMEQADML